ncbi:DUF962 domain-containing protein [Solimonas sp. K1W22B-7]|uniref:Mpo1 family 2-hydroxy fatty acid dioxygenase n=1 Tax=Solimonas sp. K1W22B-7 TaxID=2303331 RepID=UPI000E337A28|nr:Mpo1-like protein [Solimonas sp. K1W22B-7]AXQ28784.1 DUF962 domain-containing protein [Solimonas sp. K1W22B-7]
MKNLKSWLVEYSEHHADPHNRALHRLCVPATVFALCCAFRAIPVGDALWNPASLALLGWLAFYLCLSWQLALGMLMLFSVMYSAALLLETAIGGALPLFAALLFAAAGAAQYLGHRREKKQPSLLRHLRLFLIAPLWQLADFYRHMQIPVGGLASSR